MSEPTGPDYVYAGQPVYSAPHANAALDIVRELAERGPYEVEGVTVTDCVFCKAGASHDPANHDHGCLWRRAKEVYP